MFDAIAGRYDLLNDLLSMGQVRLWRRTVARITGARPGERVLDLAAGTGTSSLTFTATGADCVACDFSLGMLQAGKSRLDVTQGASEPGRLSFVAGDALRLPFRDGAFDAVTISFGLRNVADPLAGLAEMRRVTRPGGRLVGGAMEKPEPGRGGRARRPARLTGGTDPRTLAPGVGAGGERCPRTKPGPARSKLMAKNL